MYGRVEECANESVGGDDGTFFSRDLMCGCRLCVDECIHLLLLCLRSHGTEIKNRISTRLWNENQKSKINFQKPIDKLKKICYNIISPQKANSKSKGDEQNKNQKPDFQNQSSKFHF